MPQMRLLNAFSPENSNKALQYLKDFDVHVWLNTLVTGYDGKNVFLNNGKTILANTLIWAAGVKVCQLMDCQQKQ
jgi:NADH dehydrogenase